MILNTAVVEALDALGGLAPARDLDDIRTEIAGVLDMQQDPLAGQLAYGIVSNQFETDAVGPYYEGVSELSAADRERRLALALTGSDAGSFYANWILSEFDDLDDPTTRAAVQDYVSRADPSNWYAPQSAMQGVVIALSLIAKADLPLPAPVNGGSADPAWRASMTVITGALAERSGLPIDRREVEGAWAVLVGEHRDFLAGLLTILRSLHRLHAEDHQVFELVLGATPAAGVDALVWSVEHPDQVRSVSRVDLGLRNNLTDLLGRLGDGRAAEALRRFTDDPEIGEAAANAVRAIEARAGSTWRTPSTTPKP